MNCPFSKRPVPKTDGAFKPSRLNPQLVDGGEDGIRFFDYASFLTSGIHHSLAVRTALGAGRGRLIRQLVAESSLLALAGGLLGLMVAVWGVPALVSLSPGLLPGLLEVRLDLAVAGYALIISLATGILMGLVPGLRASHVDVSESLKASGGRGTEGGRPGSGFGMCSLWLRLRSP